MRANDVQRRGESRHPELYGEQIPDTRELGSANKETAPSRGAVEACHGADGRTRTGDMTLTKRLLYQLSYIGTRKKRIRAAAIVLDTAPPKQSLSNRVEDRNGWRTLAFCLPHRPTHNKDVALLCCCEAQSRHTAASLRSGFRAR
jgi:hypothetical protein